MIFENVDQLNEYIENGNSVMGCKVVGELLESMKKCAEFHRKYGFKGFGMLEEFHMGEGEEINCDEHGIINYEHLYIC